MNKRWIEDEKRPGGIGRAERQRVFWERVASGRPRHGGEQAAPAKSARQTKYAESAEIAIVTILTVMVFGLGWATLELDGVSNDFSIPPAGQDFGGESDGPAAWAIRPPTESQPNGYDGVGLSPTVDARQGIEWTSTPSPRQ